MKSAYILMQISQLQKGQGYCEEEVTAWVKEGKTKTVYELLTIKKELSQGKEYGCFLYEMV